MLLSGIAQITSFLNTLYVGDKLNASVTKLCHHKSLAPTFHKCHQHKNSVTNQLKPSQVQVQIEQKSKTEAFLSSIFEMFKKLQVKSISDWMMSPANERAILTYDF